MKARLSLSSKIFILAFINVVLLAGVFLVFARFQFHVELHSLLFGPAQDRVLSVARELALELEQTPADSRTGLLGRYAHNYGVDFYLFDNNGPEIAGREVNLPEDVREQLQRGSAPPGREPPPRFDDRPPPPEEAGPPGPPPEGRRGRKPEKRPEDRHGDNPRGGMFQVSADNLYWVGARIPVPESGSDEVRRGTLIMAAPSFYGTPLFFDFKPWLAALCAAIGIFLLCWLPFIRNLTAAISRVTRATEQIAQGNFDHQQLPEDRSDELGQLSGAINRMAARLSGFVLGQKRFLGDIAHELCAPIARIQFGLGILEQRAQDNDQRAAVEDVQEEMRQMSNLVSELLSFSKAGMEAKHKPLQTVDANAIARQAIAREAADNPAVRLQTGEPVMAMADPDYLVRALANLVRNAVRYAGEAGPITVSVRRENQDAVVTVADSGPGLPPDELERVFTPFYRLEASRNREAGGAGLGLAIVKSCVEACGGRVECRNRKPTGLEVEIRLRVA
jgi:two-component system sensor histidine kinase CpxA